MARRRIAALTSPDPAPTAGTEEEREDRIPRDARALLDQFGARASTVKVWRWNEGEGQYDYVKLVQAAEFTEDMLLARWGGGRYRGDILDGRNKHVGSIPPFGIAGDPLPIRPRAVPEPVHVAPPAPDVLSGLAPIFAAILDGQKAMLEELRRGRSPAESGIDQVVNIAKALKELAPAPAALAAGGSPMQMVKDLLETVELLGVSRGGGGTDWGPLVRDGIRPLVGVLEKKIELDRETMLRRRGGAAPVAIVPAALPSDPLERLAAQIPPMAREYLSKCAAADDDPAFNAELALRQLPAALVEQLPAILTPEDAAARLCAAIPEWAAHAEWFTEFVQELRDSLTGDQSAAGAEATT